MTVAADVRAKQVATFKHRYADQKAREAAADAARTQHRAAIDGRGVVQTFRVPTRRTRLRIVGTCPFCAGSAFDVRWPTVDVDRPHVATVAYAVCLLCSRDVARLTIGGGR